MLEPIKGAERREVGGVQVDTVRTGDARVKRIVYQPGFRIPLSVIRLPDVLEGAVPLGTEVFYSSELHGAVIDVVAGDVPAHPARLAADMFPAIAEVYAEFREQGRA